MIAFFATSARDKMVILGLIGLGAGCLIGTAWRPELKEGLLLVLGALAAAFKGNPSPPDTHTTTETTTSSSIPGPPASVVDPSPSATGDSPGGPTPN